MTPHAVSQWRERGRERGVEGLRRLPAPGRQLRLTAKQLARLPALAVALRRVKERLRHTRTVIRACISQASYGEGNRYPTFGEDK